MGKAAQKKAQQEWANEKISSIMFEGLEAFISSIWKMVSTKEPIKQRKKKFGVPMEATMPCKRGTKKHPFQETEARRSDESNKIPKTKSMHASWKLMSPQESVWNDLFQKFMKITSHTKDTIR